MKAKDLAAKLLENPEAEVYKSYYVDDLGDSTGFEQVSKIWHCRFYREFESWAEQISNCIVME